MPTPEGIGYKPEGIKNTGEQEMADMYAKGNADAVKVLEGLKTYKESSGDLDTITNEHSYLRGFAETLMAEARREIEVEEEENPEVEEIEVV